MRVLVATDQWFPDVAGGSARVAAETASRLAERGHAITVLAPRTPGQPAEVVEGSLVLRRVLARTPLPQTLTDVVATRREARRHVVGFDLLLAHQSTTGLGLAGLPGRPPLALVFHASAVREVRFLRSRLRPGVRRLSTYGLEPALVAAERAAVRRADALLVLSGFSRAVLAGDHPKVAQRIARVDGGVDTDFFSPGDGPAAARSERAFKGSEPLLVTARRLEPRMGLEELFRALTLPGAADAQLVLIGEGILAAELRALADTLGLRDRIRFAGRVSDEDLRGWYRAADLFVLPTVAYEGFGMVTVEALACGTPVVGTAVGATPELLRPLEPRLLAARPTAEALAETIGAALPLVDDEFRGRCAGYARDTFSWDVVVVRWEETLERIAAAQPARVRRG
jgi:glycosyltransferase involved in cell wall biosynthesis